MDNSTAFQEVANLSTRVPNGARVYGIFVGDLAGVVLGLYRLNGKLFYLVEFPGWPFNNRNPGQIYLLEDEIITEGEMISYRLTC